ncbi:26853_t:CDS:2, partial [Gigaspora margarita]
YWHLKKEELPEGVEFGNTYKTKLTTVFHLHDCIDSNTDIVINCSGIHARTLGGVENDDVYAARGQIVIVQLPRSYINWMFERYGEVILGGTYEKHNNSTEPDLKEATAIVQRCLSTRSDLLPQDQTNLTIKRNGIGFRPCRKGGIRIEAEWISSEKFGKKVLICHNYGHGGYGFQSSYGAAQNVIEIINKSLSSD